MRPIPDALAQLYPAHGRVTARPWWKAPVFKGAFTEGPRRVDGWALDPEPTQMAEGRWLWGANKAPGVGWFHETTSLDVAMAALDREYPLPCPPPRCGQVWAQAAGDEQRRAMVTAEAGDDGVWLNGNLYGAWPPVNALLLHDPFGHPWAPVE